MLLAKNCKKGESIENGSLMIGTLNKYRKTEDQQIGDKHEGRIRFDLKFDESATLSTQWFNTLNNVGMQIGDAQPIPFSGKCITHIKHTKIKYDKGNTVTLSNASATVHREAPNSFIFCMSLIRKTHESAGIFKSYNDCWYMNYWKAREFGYKLSLVILEKIKTQEALGNYIVPRDTDLDSLVIHTIHDTVDYLDRHIYITNQNTAKIDHLLYLLETMAFIKPKSYTHEKEYRFHFTIVSNGKYIEPLVENLLVSSETLKSYGFKV